MKLQSKDFYGVHLAAAKAMVNAWLEAHGPKVISVETLTGRFGNRPSPIFKDSMRSYPVIRVWYDAEEEIPDAPEEPSPSYSEVIEQHQPDPF